MISPSVVGVGHVGAEVVRPELFLAGDVAARRRLEADEGPALPAGGEDHAVDGMDEAMVR